MKKTSISLKSLDPLFEKLEKLTKVQRILIFTASFLILVGGFGWFGIWPNYQKINELTTEHENLENELRLATIKAAKLGKLRKDLAAAEAKFKIAGRALPENEEIPSLLAAISNSGKNAGLDFDLFQPKPEVPQDFYANIPVALTVQGSYHQIGTFFDKVSNLSRIVNIQEIKMKPSGKKDGSLKASCTAVTYKFLVVEAGIAVDEPMVADEETPPDAVEVATTATSNMETADAELDQSQAEMPAAQDEQALLTAPKRYTGEKIALDFFETDIKNVFRILREISGKNFAVDKDVSGQVTLSLDQPVPWDQVLDLILKMNQLGMTMEGDIIRIATHQTLNTERELEQQEMAAKQESLNREKALEPLITEYIPVNYANAATDVQPQIVTTPERGSVTVDARNNQIIITDTATMVSQARQTVQRIDKVTPQVMIEARIIEATNTFTRTFGARWTINAGPVFTKEFAGGLLPEGALDLTMTSSHAVAGDTLGISFTKLAGTPFELINAQLSASESEGEIKIVSAPRILTLDNKQAFIKQGLAYPITKLDADGNTVVEFQDVALQLTVTPHVTPDNRISLTMEISKNDLGTVINGQQSFTTKETTSELLVNDGDTVVIGGIRKTTKTDSDTGVPVLKNIPVLGWMFKEEVLADNLEELLIFITPKIVLLEQRSSG